MTEENLSAVPEKEARPEGIEQRVEARIAAIKALYSNEVNEEKKSAAQLALEMISMYESKQDDELVTPDRRYLKQLLEGVIEHQTVIDEKISAHLQAGWKIERLGAVMLSLLRSAVFEILQYEKLNLKVIINEYVEIAHGFFEKKDVNFVNGVLDKIAKEARSA